MAEKEFNKISEAIIAFAARVMFTSFAIGIVSMLILRSSLVEKYENIKLYAEEGKSVGLILGFSIILFYFIFKNKDNVLKGAVAVVTLVFSLIFKLIKGIFKINLKGKNTEIIENANIVTPEDEGTIEELPDINILPKPPNKSIKKAGEKIANSLKGALKKIGTKDEYISGIKIIKVTDGPVSSLIEISLPDGFKQSDIENAEDNLRAALGVVSLQVIEGSGPGQAGIITMHDDEDRVPIYLREMIASKEFKTALKKMKIPIPIGVDARGNVRFWDLTRFPHALIAGATNSGKSLWVSQVILTLSYIMPPDRLKLILLDPKRVEFGIFKELPHVITVETDAEKAVSALESIVKIMDERLILFEKMKSKNIEVYNQKVKIEDRLPYIVTIVDELSDLMIVGGAKRIEPATMRIAQLARATGIHLIIATQRPSVEVVTGVIKANLPTRISFSCTTQTDYSTVFGQEKGMKFKLTGKGDGVARLEGNLEGFMRFQGPVISLDEDEVEKTIKKLVNYYKETEKRNDDGVLDSNKLYISTPIDEGVTNLDKSNIVTLYDDKDEDYVNDSKVINLYDFNNDERADQLETDQNLHYEITLKIIDKIEKTKDGEETFVSSRKLRSELNKGTNYILEVLKEFAEKGYLESVTGKGYKVINEEVFYEMCDIFEKNQDCS